MRVSFPKHVVRREVQDETVLMNLETDNYYGLDAMATAMVERLERGESPEEIAAAVAEEFDATEEQIAGDVRRLLAELEREGLIACGP